MQVYTKFCSWLFECVWLWPPSHRDNYVTPAWFGWCVVCSHTSQFHLWGHASVVWNKSTLSCLSFQNVYLSQSSKWFVIHGIWKCPGRELHSTKMNMFVLVFTSCQTNTDHRATNAVQHESNATGPAYQTAVIYVRVVWAYSACVTEA